ncbi:MAG TPA: DUF1015 domain-containing protein, partial [Candidatus Izemoplasmatales bacterium]|nr:DUF1015 domain-containing protein [Candidatus Izemoplasmatales bacterium]
MEVVSSKEILLPKQSIDHTLWSVIACDQFTSEISYWERLRQQVEDVPSTYHLILPEAYLHLGFETRIQSANSNMNLYLRSNIFDTVSNPIIIDRKTPYHEHRYGLLLTIDLEEYEYMPGKKGRIVASEKTVLDRIPPRVKIRENAPIELPHILVLFDDVDGLIAKTASDTRNMKKLYDFDLNMGGGHITGHLLEKSAELLAKINEQIEKTPLIVGDGNHSLASAKVCWENLKKNLPEEELVGHPARYALVELESIYDKGLAFEPIHRVIYRPGDDFLEDLSRASYGQNPMKILTKKGEDYILSPESPFETIVWIQNFLDDYLAFHPDTRID